MKSDESIDAFLRQNAPYLTVKDLSDELSMEEHKVRNRCEQLGIQPIKKGEQTRQCVLAHYETKTPAQIAKLLNCTEANLRNIYKNLKLPFDNKVGVIENKKVREASKDADEKAGNKDKTSVRKILGSFQVPEAGHYHGVFGRWRY